MRILKFNDFINEAFAYPSSIKLPPKCISLLEKASSTGKWRKLLMNPSLEEIFLAESGHICIKKDGESLIFPGLVFINNELDVIEEELKLSNLIKAATLWGVSHQMGDGYTEDWYESYKWDGKWGENAKGWRRYHGDISSSIVKEMSSKLLTWIDELMSRVKIKELNPWNDIDLYRNENFKDLLELGITLDDTPILRKNGTLRLNSKNWDFPITIHSNGTIRRMSSTPAILTNAPDLVSPITSEEELDKKLKYIRSYEIKKRLELAGFTTSDINSIFKRGESPFLIIKSLLDAGRPNDVKSLYKIINPTFNTEENKEIADIIIKRKFFDLLKYAKDRIPELYKEIEALMGEDTADDASLLGDLGF